MYCRSRGTCGIAQTQSGFAIPDCNDPLRKIYDVQSFLPAADRLEQPGRKGEYPKEFLEGFSGYLHCDEYSGYNKVGSVTLVCCLAHARRKFFEAIPSEKRKNLKLLDIDPEKEIEMTKDISVLEKEKKLPAEVCFAYCNKIFFLERQYKDMKPEERKQGKHSCLTECFLWNFYAVCCVPLTLQLFTSPLL